MHTQVVHNSIWVDEDFFENSQEALFDERFTDNIQFKKTDRGFVITGVKAHLGFISVSIFLTWNERNVINLKNGWIHTTIQSMRKMVCMATARGQLI